MNQITNLSQYKADYNNLMDSFFEIRCLLEQVGAIILQASCSEELISDEIETNQTNASLARLSKLVLRKIFSILEVLEPRLKNQVLNDFSNSITDLSIALDVASKSHLTTRNQTNLFYGLFHAVGELEKDLDSLEVELEAQYKEKSNG